MYTVMCSMCQWDRTHSYFFVGPSATQIYRVASQPYSVKKLEASTARQGGANQCLHAKQLSTNDVLHLHQLMFQ